ncbi:hypothetical protein BT96DRAFT_1052452, partial [Gymnopus androsaceus JB14]
ILKDATEFFSSNSLNISAVIPAMDTINEASATGIIEQKELCTPLCYALLVGKKTLNKYYSLSDDSHIYRIAMVLHPSFKLSYFRRLNWQEQWIQDAVHVTWNAWTQLKPMVPSSAAPQTEEASVRILFIIPIPLPLMHCMVI